MGGLNPYTYPLNPVSRIDPLGLAQDKTEKCASIKSRIENLEKEIWEKRYPDLKNDPRGLPYKAWPGSALRDSVQGHEILITIALRNLDNAHKEWVDNKCDDPPPPAAPASCPENNSNLAENAAKAGGTAVALYVGYKIMRAVVVSFVATPAGGVASLAIP